MDSLQSDSKQIQLQNQVNTQPQKIIQKQNDQQNSILQSNPLQNNRNFWIAIIFLIFVVAFIILFALYSKTIDYSNIQSNKESDISNNSSDIQLFKNHSQQYELIKLNSTSALCLDGSQSAYLMSKTGNPQKILIHFTGGAWCTEGQATTQQKFLQYCYQRSKIFLGTSQYTLNPTIFQKGFYGNHPKNYFKDWKRIYLTYCDGTGHQGSRKQPVNVNGSLIYFRGYNITTQKFDDLNKRLGLYESAKNVIVTGDSAGGLAVLIWANYLKQKVKGGEVRAIADASIFYDGYNKIKQMHSFRQSFKIMMGITNVQVNHPIQQCAKQFPDNKQNCMFAQYLYKYIKVPLFAINALYDTYGLPCIYGQFCVWRTLQNCNSQDIQVIQNNRRSVMGVLRQIAKDKRNGVWGFGCILHETIIHDSIFDLKYTIPLNSKFTVMESIKIWMQNTSSDNIHLDQEIYSSNKKCPS